MKLLSDYLRLIVFFSAALIGVQVPSFVDLYGQKLESHALESSHSISQFQNDADKYFDGDLKLLVKHYQSKSDPIIVDGGDSIANLLERNIILRSALINFKKNTLSRYQHSLYQPLTEIQKETIDAYDYSIKLNLSGIVWAISAGFLISFLIETLMMLCIACCKFIFTKPKPSTRLSRIKDPEF